MSLLLNYWSISSIELCEEAKNLGLEVEVLDKKTNAFYIKGNGQDILFKSTDFGGNTALGYKICLDKSLTYKVLERYNMPIAHSIYLSVQEFGDFSSSAIKHLKMPLVIKPLADGHGNGVMMNINSYGELVEKLRISFENYKDMIIQEQAKGEEMRILVVKGEVILAINRVPAQVIGNGKDQIHKLIKNENLNPLRGEGYETPLSYIKVDDELKSYLKKQNLDINSIPYLGEIIRLRGNSNLGTGGTPINITNLLTKKTKELCIKIANILGLEIAGIDIMMTDFSKEISEVGGIILEVGATPGIGGHKQTIGFNTAKEILIRVFNI